MNYESSDLQEAPDLRDFVEEIFSFNSERARSVRNAMTYQFTPKRKALNCQGLTFEVILNHGRYNYVKETLGKLAQVEQADQQMQDNAVVGESVMPGQMRYKRSLRPHMPPPGMAACPFDDLEHSPLLIKRLSCNGKQYGLVVNNRPWGYHHCMLVTFDLEPHLMKEQELLASFQLLRNLGSDYEGIFTGILAGASVYHFHLQVHKGSSAIWGNLERGNVQLKSFYFSKKVIAHWVQGWPAHFFVFEGSDCNGLACVVNQMIEALVAGDNDYPYNIGFRCQNNLIQLILFPKSGTSEKPTGLNDHPDSWGRFSFLEMGGSIYLLTPEGYEANQRIYDAIAQLSIQRLEMAALITDFQERTHKDKSQF